MKKALLILLFSIVKTVSAQEAAPYRVHSKAVNRLVNQLNTAITGKITEAVLTARTPVFVDEACTQKMPQTDFKSITQKKVIFKAGQDWEGRKLTVDTSVTFRFGASWMTQFKMGPAQQLWIFITFPAALNIPGKWQWCVKPADYRKLLSEIELDYLIAVASDGGIPLAQAGANLWSVVEKTRTAFLLSEIQKFKNTGLSDTLTNLEFQENYRLQALENVIQDSAHREFDYQRAVTVPLIADSLKGFAFKSSLRKDPMGGANVALTPYSVSPLWDPSGSGGDPFMLEPTYWIAASDYLKRLNAAERNKISLIMLLLIQERMDTDCTF